MKRLFMSALSIAIITSLVLQMTCVAFGQTIDELKTNFENAEQIVNTDDETTDEYMKYSYILGEENEKREEFVKHYITEDKDYIAAVYDNPVHYLDDNGNWIDYDNSLYKTVDSKNDVYYKNTSSNVSVSFAESSKSENVVNIEKDGYKISWGFVDLNTSVKADENQTEAFTTVDETESNSPINDVNSDIIATEPIDVLTPGITKESNSTVNDCKLDIVQNESSTKDQRLNEAKAKNSVEEYNKEFIALEHLKSTVKYNNLYDSTNVEYSIISNTIKENIELVDNKASNSISFLVEHEGLKAELTTDGRIVFTNENKTVFSFDIPFAYDAKEVYTDKVNYELQNFENSSLVTIVLDKEWFCDNDRKFPIIIDPVTQTEQTTNNISEAFVASGLPNQCLGYNGSVSVGEENSEGICYTYIKFENLPSLANGDVIVGANISLVQRKNDPGNIDGLPDGFSADPSSITELVTYAYEVTGSWDEGTINYNNKPNNASAISDYNILTAHSDYTWVSYDVSKLMRKWYNTSSSNNGIVIKGDVPSGKKVITRFLASNYPDLTSNAYPVGTVCYRNATGLEDYWCYQSQSIGNSGNGYVNVFNGNLTFTQLVGVTSTTLTPASVSLIYNLTNKDSLSGKAGYGWRISAIQRVDSNNDPNWSSQYPYYYTDGDGTKHYFYNNNGTYNDEDGLGLTYTAVNDGTNIKHKITTKDGAVSKFDNNGYLREYTDPNSHKTTYTYNGQRLVEIKDSFNNTLTLTYDENTGILETVEDDLGNVAELIHSDSYLLTGVNYKGYTTNFTYSGRKLSSASNPLSNGIVYEYGVDCGRSRISQVSVKSIDGTRTGSSFKLSYKDGITTSVTDPGLDGTYDTSDDKLYTYNFDKFGRCNDIYDNEGNANTYKYYTNQTGSNIKKNNALLKSGSTQKTVCNYLKNTNFTDDTDNWNPFNMGGSTQCSVQTSVTTGSGTNIIDTMPLMFTSNTSGTSGTIQSVSLSSGTYTFSAYVKAFGVTKTESSGGFGIAVIDGNNQVKGWSELFDGYTDTSIDKGWRRVSVTFNYTGSSSYNFYCGFKDAYGTAFMKCPQLEQADGPSNYNIAEDAGFEENAISKWIQHKSSPSSGIGDMSIETGDGNFKYGSKALKIPGSLKEWNSVTQTLDISGNAGDVYALSAWTKACAKAATDENATNKPKYAIEIELKYTDSDSDKETIDCNTEVTDWQYAAGVIAAKKAYNSIEIHLCYDYQVNSAIFDGIQLIRDNAGSYQYDDNGNLISTTDAVNNSQYSYNGNSNITQIQNPTGTSYNYSYDLKHQMITAKDSYGTQYSINYDANGNPINTSNWEKYTEGSTVSSIDDNKSYYIKSVSTGKYFDVVNFSTSDNSIVKLCSLNKGENQKFKFVKQGNEGYRLLPNHSQNKMLRFSNGSLVQDPYDSSSEYGKFVFTKISGTNKYYINDKKTRNRLSSSGNNIVLVDRATTGSSVEWELSECGSHIDTEYTYNSGGTLLTSVKDSRGKTTSYAYDNKARVVSTTNANGNTTSTTYDDTTSQIESISAQNGSNTSTIQYVYNSNYTQLIGIKREDPIYRYYNFSYDDFGNLSQTKVGNQVLSTNTYNEKTGLLTNSTYGNGNYIDYIYDTDYNLTTKKYNGTDKFKYSYDSSGNLTLKNDLVNNIKTTYIYDLIGRIVGMTADNGVTLGRVYDSFGRVKMNTVRIGDINTRTQYVYGDSSQGEYQDGIYSVKLDGTQILSYNYDGLGRLDTRDLNCGNATITSTYTYCSGSGSGSADATTNLVDKYNNGVINYKYLYDDLGNITKIINYDASNISNSTVLAEYEYDDFNQLVCEHNSQIGKTIRYTYDGYGNILTKSEYTLNAPANATPTVTYTYGYDTGAWKDRLTSYNGTALTYDEIGNPLQYTSGTTFTWQNGRQLATANRSGKDLTFKYDDNGIRTEKVCVSYPASGTKTETTKFYLDGSTILAQETTGVLETSIYGTITTTNLATVRLDFFYDETGDVVGFKYGGAKYFYIKNLQGDITDIVDNTGTIVVTYKYDTWGKVKSTTGTMASTIGNKNPFRYRSYYYDTDLALYYLQSRYYDPNTGRFINADSLIVTYDIFGFNLFAYCLNDPVNNIDPTGNLTYCGPSKDYDYESFYRRYQKRKAKEASSNTSIACSSSLPFKGEPGSSQVLQNPDGTPKQKRWYGPDGTPERDRDYNHPGDLPFPHDHVWENGVRSPEHLPPSPDYEISLDVAVGVCLVTVCAVAMVGVAVDDVTGVGVLDDFLLAPLAAGMGVGMILIFE